MRPFKILLSALVAGGFASAAIAQTPMAFKTRDEAEKQVTVICKEKMN
jgi:hypothetical protein